MAKNIWDEFDKAVDTKALAEEIKEAEKNGGTGNFREVPHGDYEVEINKMELGKSKKGDPMVTVWFKIVSGEYKGSLIFMNQVVNLSFQIHIVNEIFRGIVANIPDMEIKFETYNQYGNLIMDVFEAVDGNYEFALAYEERKNGFSTYEITEVYELE